MPEIHAGIQNMMGVTILVVGVVYLFLQAVTFIIAAIIQVED
jgi:hypothetical protein